MSKSDSQAVSPLQAKLLELWRAFDGTLVPGPWLGRSDAMMLPPLEDVQVRVFTDSVGLTSKADLHGVAHIDGEQYAWIGVIHTGAEPAGDSDVDRLFDSASTELATALGEFDGVVPWLLSPSGIKSGARGRLLEAGALFSGRSDVRNLLEAFDIDPSPEL